METFLHFTCAARKINFSIYLCTSFFLCFLLFPSVAQSQEIKASFSGNRLKISENNTHQDIPTRVGLKNYDKATGINGITLKVNFDPTLIHKDSITVRADGNLLNLSPGEYLEMQRTDSACIFYSLTTKGNEKALEMEEMPLLVDFKIKPKAYYELLANNCEYTISFSVESFKAYDLKGVEFIPAPFTLPVDVVCPDKGEPLPLKAAPNPTSGLFWVYLPVEKRDNVADLKVYDIRGMLVAAETEIQENGQVRVDLNGFKFGQYFLHISYNDGTKDYAKVILMQLGS